MLLGRAAEALEHYEHALAFCEKMQSPPLMEACRTRRASALERLRVGTETGVRRPPPRRGPTLSFEMLREEESWEIRAESKPAFRLKHSKGLAYLQQLLARPTHEFHVLDLAGLDDHAGSATPVLDPRAKQQYRDRVQHVRDELVEAEARADTVYASKLREELERISEQLASAVGLHGRDRKMSSTVERTRINVQRCLKDAIERIAGADPELGRYLSATVKSGTYCVFKPL
jgi:non-specific serine/threonine protein kinase